VRSRRLLGDRFAGEIADDHADVLVADVDANRECRARRSETPQD
jgi:hypothetical protein